MQNKSPLRIYLASSWRNEFYPGVLALLRSAGHEVYDFRNPAPGNHGFAWSEIDENWLGWTPHKFIDALEHPIAEHGYSLDKAALDWCNALVLLLPCGRSTHLEAGYAIGQGKPVVIFIPIDCQFEPELMYKLAHKTVSAQEPLIEALHDISFGINAMPPAELAALWLKQHAFEAAKTLTQHMRDGEPFFAVEAAKHILSYTIDQPTLLDEVR